MTNRSSACCLSETLPTPTAGVCELGIGQGERLTYAIYGIMLEGGWLIKPKLAACSPFSPICLLRGL